ncbi:MAG: RHS repeat-associated core domain-containing protein, partial [Vicinamibacterales bacterium]
TWTDVDGLGRPIAAYVNRSTGAPDWVKTLVSTTAYVDAVVGVVRPNVVSQSLLDYAPLPARWTREETRLDSRGRPVQVLAKTGAATLDAITTYDYDFKGKLVGVTLPDPSAAASSAATVAYSYGYDSLGRPTSMRRPVITGAASGVDMSYNGLVTTSDEVAGGQVGPVGRKVLVNDRYGRLSEVREYTNVSAGTFATTLYKYDAHDAVNWIQNPDGVVTLLQHDFAGRRVRIDRAGRSWTYGYDKHGDLTSETLPAPSLLLTAQYTNGYTYDALDRMSTRTVGGRQVIAADKDLLGIGQITFGYDSCANGVGRLCTATIPNGHLTTSYAYDVEGNQTTETRAFSFGNLAAGAGNVTGTRVTELKYGPGGRVVEQTYADNAVGSAAKTRTQYTYDDRGLPIGVGWVAAPTAIPTPTPPPAGSVRPLANQVRNVAGQVLTRQAVLAAAPTATWRNVTSTWTYDKLSRVTSQTVADTSVQHAKQTLTYHGLDDPKTLQHVMGIVGGPTYNFTYSYDPRHQLTTVTESAGKYGSSYAFTAGGKLARATVTRTAAAATGTEMVLRDVNYAYTSPVDPEAPSALVPFAGGANLRSYSYDTVGNLMSRRNGAATVPATDDFLYDGDDQLRRASKYTISGNTRTLSGVEEYYYDHDGQRAAVVTRNATNAVTAVRVFVDDTELELNPASGASNGAVVKAYAHLSLGTPVARIVAPAGGWTSSSTAATTPATVELMYQGLSSNTLVSVLPNGTVQAGFVYGPYGDVVQTAGATGTLATLRRRFNDKFRDDLTSLQYYGVRYYDNLMLGWTQADPLYRFVPDAAWGEPRRAGLYQFNMGNPLRYIDPDGRNPAQALASRFAPMVESSASSAGAHIAGGLAAVGTGIAVMIDSGARYGQYMDEGGMYSPGYYNEYYADPAEVKAVWAQFEAMRDSVNQFMQNQNAASTQGGRGTGVDGTKAPDVVTANGQPAAPDGTPLGPSGKKVFHNSDSPTRKKAVDGAKAQGGGAVVVDKATKKQQKHWHGTKPGGKRVSGPKKTHWTVRGTKPKRQPPPSPKKPQ